MRACNLHINMHAIYMYMHVPNIHDIMHVHVRAKVGGGGILQVLGNI